MPGLQGWTSGEFFVSLVAAVILLAAFCLYNSRSARHVLNFSILRRQAVRLNLFNLFVVTFINIGISFVLPLVAEVDLKKSSITNAVALLTHA